jgi:hypothetical protein
LIDRFGPALPAVPPGVRTQAIENVHELPHWPDVSRCEHPECVEPLETCQLCCDATAQMSGRSAD